jgi:hypothetical protein
MADANPPQSFYQGGDQRGDSRHRGGIIWRALMNEIVFATSMVAGLSAALCIGLIFLGVALGQIDV